MNILVIDDEQGLRDLLAFELTMNGHTVVTVTNGEEGIEKYKTAIYDLVISDLRMPKVGGLEVVKAIRGFNQNAKIILTSGFEAANIIEECMRQGAYKFIAKPYSLAELFEVILEISRMTEPQPGTQAG